MTKVRSDRSTDGVEVAGPAQPIGHIPHARVASDRSTRLAFGVFAGVEAFALVLYTWMGRGLWFWYDEWDFLAARTAGNAHALFAPHGNVHPSTLPILAYRLLWTAFGLRTYVPYRLTLIVLHLIAAFLVLVIMRRVGVEPWTATIAASLFVFFGNGYEDILWPFQIGFVGSLVFGLAQFLLADHDGPLDRRDWLGLGAGFAALLCSAVGLATVLGVGVTTGLRRGWKVALVHTAPPLTLYVVWWATLAHSTYVAPEASRPSSVSGVITFVVRGLRNDFRALGGSFVVAALLAAVLVVGLALAWHGLPLRRLRTEAALPVGLTSAAVAFLAIAGVGREGTGGGDPADRSRYLYIVAGLMLPTLAVAADAIIRRWRVVAPFALALFLIGIPGNLHAASSYVHRQREHVGPSYRRMFLSIPTLTTAHEAPRQLKPPTDHFFFYAVTVGWLLDSAASGRIPAPPRVTPAEAAIDEVRLSFNPYLGADQSLHSYLVQCISAPRGGQRPAPEAVHLEPGQTIKVSGGTVRLLPAVGSVLGTYPLIIDGTKGVHWLTAIRPVALRADIQMITGARAQVCVSPGAASTVSARSARRYDKRPARQLASVITAAARALQAVRR